MRTLQLKYLFLGLSLNIFALSLAVAEEVPSVISDIDINIATHGGFEFGNGSGINKSFVPGISYQSVVVADLYVTESLSQSTLPPGWNTGVWGNQPVIYRWYNQTSKMMEVILKRTQNEFWRCILAGVLEVKKSHQYRKSSRDMGSSDG